jgi:D-alanyl-D-alanine carboxypeptidase (penicillin-binding protein 5/6)
MTIRRSVRVALTSAIVLLSLTGSEVGADLSATVPAPTVAGKSFIVIDHETHAVLAEENADLQVEPASLTKILTVYVAAHALADGLIKLDDEVLVSEKAWRMEGSRMFIEVGKTVSVADLLIGIIVVSGNDASVALAEHVSGSEEVFASLMNKHAQALGMRHSSFSNATGLPDPKTYTTARDIALLSSALIREFPDIYRQFALKEFKYGIERAQPNRNRLLYRDATVDGVKTGHTETAGFCLVASALRDGMRVISAVTGTASDDARTEASHALLNYGFRFFETREVYAAKQVVATPRVWGGAVDQVELGPGKSVSVTLPRGRFNEVQATARIDEPIAAPFDAGQVLGKLVLAIDGEDIAEIPLAANQAVGAGSWFGRLYDATLLLFE